MQGFGADAALSDRTAGSSAEASSKGTKAAKSRQERVTKPERTGGSPVEKPLARDNPTGGRTAVEQVAILRICWR